MYEHEFAIHTGRYLLQPYSKIIEFYTLSSFRLIDSSVVVISYNYICSIQLKFHSKLIAKHVGAYNMQCIIT